MPEKSYESGRAAVDAIIFTIKDRHLQVYLEVREKAPFEALLELPGGLLLPEETAEQTLHRKLAEIVGRREVYFRQFYTFTDPQRDPRQRTVSIAFLALVSEEKLQSPHFYPVNSLPKLAFDHTKIVKQAVAFLREHLDEQLVRQFLPKYFALNELQAVYEVVADQQFDNRNFRKRMLDSGVVKKVAKTQKNVSHRPAALFTFV